MADASGSALETVESETKANYATTRGHASDGFHLDSVRHQDHALDRGHTTAHDEQSSQSPGDRHSFPENDETSLFKPNGLSDSDDRGSELLSDREMHRHFMDIESSFLPDSISNQQRQHEEQRVGNDDTYLEFGHKGQTSPAEEMSQVEEINVAGTTYRTPSINRAFEQPAYVKDNISNPSSPAQAALRRTYARLVPRSGYEHDTLSSSTAEAPSSRPESQATARPGSKGSTTDSMSASRSSAATEKQWISSHLRQARADVAADTSLSSDLSEDDSMLNVDSALQTGGAMFGHNTLANSRAGLSARLPSFASTASHQDILLETPKANGTRFQAPTDTVLARRVESIMVPETIARDFRARNRSISPEKRPNSANGVPSAFQTRNNRTLTLKEQNNKVDKLTKENFDLKLKIHFLDQALQSRSDDGVKELIDKNVQLQTDLANERKEAQTMRRKARELERKMKEMHEQLLEARLQKQDALNAEDDPTLQAEMHQEILFLRQQLDRSENQVTTLHEEVMTKELEKRKMADHMRSMAGDRNEDTAGMKETMDMWQDLLNAETGRREQAEDDLRKVRDDLQALRLQRAASSFHDDRAKPRSGSNAETDADSRPETSNDSTTLVEHLKHENAELRRDLGAQTSMLTSRNRERERLQQEIEELKLLHRKGDGARSIAGDSIFDRSVSRAQARPGSRGNDFVPSIRVSATDGEREDWEKKENQLRDQNAELRLKFQELERTHQTHLQYTTTIEGDFQELENELNEATEDLKAIQTERDDALTAFEEKQVEYKRLEQEALSEIDKLIKEVESLEGQLQDQQKKGQKLQSKLDHVSDGYKGLQGELRQITQSVMNLEDEKQANIRSIQTLEQQLVDAEEEIQTLETKYSELHEKHRKLEVTQESLHSEITFLREEQESDKIRIGQLESALDAAQQTVQDEQEKLRDMEQTMLEERHQRDVLENQSKEEVQKVLDDLNGECGRTKDEVRKLRRSLSTKEVEASSWKQKLDELEANLRFILGEPTGTKQGLLAEIERTQRELESTITNLDRTKMEIADKDRLLRHRDGLLESTSLESRRLSDLLDKERASRKHDLEQFEKASRGQATHIRQAAQQESRILELETAYSQDKRRMAAQEAHYQEQLSERNNLLLALWNRLSTLCGVDWSQQNSLVNGEVPSSEVIGRGLPAFNRNILLAVKTIEAVLGGFKARIRTIEKDLWRDYQTLEQNVELRMRRLDELEQGVAEMEQEAFEREQRQQQVRPLSRAGTLTKSFRSSEETVKLKNEIKILKTELKVHRQHPSPLASQMLHQQQQEPLGRRASISTGNGRSQTSPARAVLSLLSRTHSVADQAQQPNFYAADTFDGSRQSSIRSSRVLTEQPPPAQLSADGGGDTKWIHRLRELERRLKQEREGRLLDRKGARQRLDEGRAENEELRLMLEHEKTRRELMAADAERVMGASSRQTQAHSEHEQNDAEFDEALLIGGQDTMR